MQGVWPCIEASPIVCLPRYEIQIFSVSREDALIKSSEKLAKDSFFFVMADSKLVTAFLKGKVSALLDEGQSERQVS